MERYQIMELTLERVMHDFNSFLSRQVARKGLGAFASLNEMRGAIGQEYDEVKRALDARNDPQHILAELMDLAVAAIFSCACITARDDLYFQQKDRREGE